MDTGALSMRVGTCAGGFGARPRPWARAATALSLAVPSVWCLALLLGTCGPESARAEEPVAPQAMTGAAAPATGDRATPAPGQFGTTSQYRIGPGDVIQVFVWRNPELSVTIPVRPDGKISSPLVEDLVAVGKTPAQLARDIEVTLSEYVRNPQVNIIVTNAASAFSQVKAIGQVKSPQSIAYREGMTVLDLILMAGGLTEFAAGNRAKIIRKDEQGHQQMIKVRLNDLVTKGKVSESIALKPGDVLMVPEAIF
jgi:polysaccharide biosynthesis/export protein